MKASLEERVKNIVGDLLGVEPETIKDEQILIDDLGMDSLDGVEIVLNLEDEFEVEIQDGEVDHVKTVGQLISFMKEKTNV